jgi:hypothetical protein
MVGDGKRLGHVFFTEHAARLDCYVAIRLCGSDQAERVGARCQTGCACDLSRSARSSCALVCESARYLRGCLAVVQLIPPEIMAEHRATPAMASERPVSHSGAAVIVLIWFASIVIISWLGYRFFEGWR